MINIALFGPPGAGKGTQSAFLLEKYNLSYVSTGDILRREMAEGTQLGAEAADIIASGGLVSDEIIVQLIEKTIRSNPNANGFLFDGFPRTYIQAYILEGLMIKLNTSLNCLISIEIPDKEAVQRLLLRGRMSGRSDDNKQVIQNRIEEYHLKTLPVLKYYIEKGTYYAIDGTRSIEEVSAAIDDIVQAELSKNKLNIVLFGYPGSGRGSQGKALAMEYGLEYIATGPMLEEEIEKDTETGRQIASLYENGQLVPDEIVVPLIERKLEHSRGVKGFIFKGFPRTLVQSYILDGLLKKHGTTISMVMEIEVPTLELINRLDARSKTDHCMPYDTSTTKIVKRLQEHEIKTVPVINKYNHLHGVTKINGVGDFETVTKRLTEAIDKAYHANF